MSNDFYDDNARTLLVAGVEVNRRSPKTFDTTPLPHLTDYSQGGTVMARGMQHLDEAVPNGQGARSEMAARCLVAGLQITLKWLKAKGLDVPTIEVYDPSWGATNKRVQVPMGHVLWTNADKNPPTRILDRNGEVVLSMCKLCGKAESELTETFCPAMDERAPAQLAKPDRNAVVMLDRRADGSTTQHREEPKLTSRPQQKAYDDDQVDRFAFLLKARLDEKRHAGKAGWYGDDRATIKRCIDGYIKHSRGGNLMDAAAYLMMLDYHGYSRTPVEHHGLINRLSAWWSAK